MTFKETLMEAGFDESAAKLLATDNWFLERHHSKSASELKEKINLATKIYCVENGDIYKAILTHPPFIDLDHQRVINGIKETYNCTSEQASKAILKFSAFAGYDHQRVIKEVKEAYNCTTEQASKAIFTHPAFAGLNHKRVIKGVKEAYNCTIKQASKIILKFPAFAGYDHQRVIKEVKEAYNCTTEQASKAILKFPQFAGLNHQRVIRQLGRVGRMLGFKEDKIKLEILRNPVFAGYSAKRYLAAIDVVKHLDINGMINESMFHTWKNYSSKSPYVPDTKRLNITKALRQSQYNAEPPLMKVLRRSIENRNKKKVA